MNKKIYTIGFTKKSLAEFIKSLQKAKVTLVVDIRLNNTSQLAGYSKGRDLAFLLKEGFGIGYCHEVNLAPTQEILKRFKSDGDWERYTEDFMALLKSREVIELGKELMSKGTICLLCTESTAHKCHRRLISEYWAEKLDGIEVSHL
ncbi:MAG: DUF488 domain-containing protein [bacterium]|nr:DUF488 domain-containing protein [bacterium]